MKNSVCFVLKDTLWVPLVFFFNTTIKCSVTEHELRKNEEHFCYTAVADETIESVKKNKLSQIVVKVSVLFIFIKNIHTHLWLILCVTNLGERL